MKAVCVDVKASYSALKQIVAHDISINKAARDLGVQDISIDNETEGWCAGNESR